uniref:Glutaredoxin-like protein n=1 Tax=Onchocerca volvulus TaxID=6282 RepID=A0A8R1TRD6_ONCVO
MLAIRFITKSYYTKKRPLQLHLLTTTCCPLCDHFKQQLDNYIFHQRSLTHLLQVETINIDNNTHFEKYKYDVPVLLFNEKVLLKHRFRREEFEKALAVICNK